ncbi:replication initiation protein RepM [Thiofilum flexile]|uniref:replication initiation protein RepM n=1 Tax=Thiofilum flexile TaxID=125627 RepID=UPI0003810F29|nr:replication initiation protein RepM [Thiofilum flexile]
MNNLVVKDNALINASYSLSLVEQRLILLAIIAARNERKVIDEKTKIAVSADSYINQFGTHRTTAYQALKDACNNLFNRYFTYQEKNGGIATMKSRWVSKIGYVDEFAVVKITFAPDVIPLITELESRFTQYELEQVSSLSSVYAVRLYELLIMWRSTGKTPMIELYELRNKVGVLDGEYAAMHNFKKRVIDVALEQINEHTDITVSYEQHKQGRVIVGFSFTFKFKKPRKTTSNTALDTKPSTKAAPDENALKNEALSQFLGYQQQAKILNESIEQLATEKEIQRFKEYGFMK